MLTIKEVAKLVELNEATVYNLAQQWSPLNERSGNTMVVFRTRGICSSSRKKASFSERRNIVTRMVIYSAIGAAT